MSMREVDPSSLEIDAIAEAQLQAELRGLFIVDTQNYLQRYSQLAQVLQPETWKTDIQELYRCIHTIKGGAVTVAAEAILQVSTALEDLLSDLRYLEVAPILSDDHLQQSLLEGGELLTGLLVQDTGEIEPILRRVQTLHQEVQERYLPHWNPQRQLHQDFAEQGLDMVVLELQIALERLSEASVPPGATVPAATIDTARQTLVQLHQIGDELQLASGWRDLLHQAEELLTCPTVNLWRSQWFLLFQALKTCAKQSGSLTPLEWTIVEPTASIAENADCLTIPLERDRAVADQNAWEALSLESLDLRGFLDRGFLDREFSDREFLESTQPLTSETAFTDATNVFDPAFADEQPDSEALQIDALETRQTEDKVEPLLVENQPFERSSLPSVQDWFGLPTPESDPLEDVSPETEIIDISAFEVSIEQEKSQPVADQLPVLEAMPEPAKEQIPVSLEKLDRASQSLVETLLGLRATQGLYQTLQNQMAQLVALAQEGVQSITLLRQIQDDYALLNVQRQQTTQGLNPERYRQGYTVMNRLLETNLRLSEIGAEAGKMTEQITTNLRSVDTSVLKLQDTIEDSRLVSFQTLGIRARAVLRDLVTRYGKPARLIILGEHTELDVSTARALEPALLHLIRNAYDHGLETTVERMAQGKPEQGTIVVSLRRRSNQFLLEFKDDGRGMDAAKIRSRAETLNFPLTQTATSEEILRVICQPGFSSEVEANEISGRGVGMDVVAAQVSRLGGKLRLETRLETGTTFEIQFPAPRLLVPCVLVRAGDYTFAIPEDEIRTITLLGSLNTGEAEPLESVNRDLNPMAMPQPNVIDQGVVQNEPSPAPRLDLLEYWQPHLAGRSLPETAIGLWIQPETRQNAQADGIWLLADELLEQSELVINPLPSPLVVPIGVLGVSLQVNGSLIPVLEARSLAEWWLALPVRQSISEAISTDLPGRETSGSVQTILVVDDAALMRRRLEASLSANGYTIHTCADGQEAWHWLQEHPNPSLILTDIEMPNMDGFTLIDRCRQHGIMVPVLVVSSRLSEEWFNEAKRLGASDYLTKGFATVELISKVNKLLNLSSSVAK